MASHADRSHTVPNRILLPTIAALAFAAACGSTEPKVDVTPATITGTPTDTIHATVGSTVVTPLTVVVKNKAGSPIDSALVTFAVTGGGGTVSAASVRTDVNGQATTSWTLGPTAGVQSATATATGLTAVSFVAVAAPGAPAAVTKAGGDAQSALAGANVPVAPSVKVADSFGNPLPNVLVTFAVASGGGSVTGALANTNASGIATIGSWKLGGTIGANTLTATAGSLPLVTFTATGTVGAASQVKITNTAPTLATGQAFKLTAQALDANNNAIPNATITWSSSNPAVATVDTTGNVTAVGSGNTTITAASGTGTGTQVVSVIGHPAGVIVGSASLGGFMKSLAVNKTTAYAGVFTGNAVGSVDLATATAGAATVPVGGNVVDVAVGGSVIVAATGAPTPTLVLIDAGTQAVTQTIDMGGINPFHVAITSDGKKIFVDRADFSLVTIDAASGAITSTISVPGIGNAMKMAAGDSLLYIGTALGTVFEIDARTSQIKRTIRPTSAVSDLAVSRDGKTLYTIDGSSNDVTMTALAGGGLSGTVTFVSIPQGVAISPDNQALWVSLNGSVFNAPFQDGTFSTDVFSSNIPIPGPGAPNLIVMSPLGDFVVTIDGASNKIYVLK
jgi:Big-like domain-containing protein